LLDGGGPARERRIAVEFRSRHTAPVTLVLRDGLVSAEEPGGPTDVRVSFDPATLNLMLFGRISRVRAVLTGKVAVRGRRPWLLPAFLRTVRVPDLGRSGAIVHREPA
jgi:putative sterol carrier protein